MLLQNSELRFALYSSDWYLADKEYARTAQLMMVRTLKPLTLTAIKMYPVSVEILVGASIQSLLIATRLINPYFKRESFPVK